MKGSGIVLESTIAILAMLLILAFFVVTVFNEGISRQRIVLEELELTAAKNAFALTRDALDTTWHVSSIQALFRAGDEALGCGYDDDPYLEAAATGPPPLEDGFWYQYDPTKVKTAESILLAERINDEAKYTDSTTDPVICFPKDNHVLDYMRAKFAPFMEIQKFFTLGAVNVEVNPLSNSFFFAPQRVLSLTRESLAAKLGTTDVLREESHSNAIDTRFQNMHRAAQNIVRWFILFSDQMDNTRGGAPLETRWRYQDASAPVLGIPFDANKDAYLSRIKDVVEAPITGAGQALGVETRVFSSYELLPLQQETLQGLMYVAPFNGMALHYRMSVSFIEAAGVIEEEAEYTWPTASFRLTSCFGEPRPTGPPHPGLDIGAVAATVEGDSVFAAESGVVTSVTSICEENDEECGGAYGNNVRIKHEDGRETTYAHLASVRVSEGDAVEDGQIIGTMGNTGRSKGVHLHFEVRSSDGTPLNPCNFIQCSLSKGPEFCAAGGAFAGNYYFHDEDANKFTKRPFALSFSAEDYVLAIDCRESPYVGAFNTGDELKDSQMEGAANSLRLFSWQQPRDIVCCGGRLWTCNVDGLPEGEWSRSSGEQINDQECSGSLERFFGGRDLVCTAQGVFDLVR